MVHDQCRASNDAVDAARDLVVEVDSSALKSNNIARPGVQGGGLCKTA